MSRKPRPKRDQAIVSTERDGRRQRSRRSRENIIKAMWELMLDGDMDPSAAAIAERADVGLRSVFRHFEDLDTLHREIVLMAEAEIMPQVMQPLQSSHWKDQIVERADLMVELWNRILIPHTAGEIRRFKSDVLMDDFKRCRNLELSGVKAILPPDIPDYDNVLLALDNAISFSTLRRLRQDRNLSVSKTKEVVLFMIRAIIDPID